MIKQNKRSQEDLEDTGGWDKDKMTDKTIEEVIETLEKIRKEFKSIWGWMLTIWIILFIILGITIRNVIILAS